MLWRMYRKGSPPALSCFSDHRGLCSRLGLVAVGGLWEVVWLFIDLSYTLSCAASKCNEFHVSLCVVYSPSCWDSPVWCHPYSLPLLPDTLVMKSSKEPFPVYSSSHHLYFMDLLLLLPKKRILICLILSTQNSLTLSLPAPFQYTLCGWLRSSFDFNTQHSWQWIKTFRFLPGAGSDTSWSPSSQ